LTNRVYPDMDGSFSVEVIPSSLDLEEKSKNLRPPQ
jgi:hypothetical protein